MVDVEPHDFRPLGPLDRWQKNGRCFHCYWYRDHHPTTSWVTARPYGDKSRPREGADAREEQK